MSRTKKYFLPRQDANLNAFEENFVNKFTENRSNFQMLPEEADYIIASINAHRTAYSTMISKKASSKAATETNLAAKKRAIYDIRRCAHMVRSSRFYTTAIGYDLGIIGSEEAPADQSLLKPVLKAKVIGSHVYIKYSKQKMDGINIYSKRSHQSEFRLIHKSMSIPFVDDRIKFDESQPEIREYYAVYLKDFKEVGLQSDMIKVVVR